MKFMGHLHRLKLKNELKKETIDREKNEDIFAELIQVIDDRSLALIMRDAIDDGKKALQILREHYMSQSKPKILSLYTELATLEKTDGEDITGYVIRAERAIAALRNCDEIVSDALAIAMLLKGLPSNYNTLKAIITQKDSQQTLQEFKASLNAYEENHRSQRREEAVMKMTTTQQRPAVTCFRCKKVGHVVRNCDKPRWCKICESKTHDTYFCRKERINNVEEKDYPKDYSKDYSYYKVCTDTNFNSKNFEILVDCGATTHVVTDIDRFCQFENDFDPKATYIELADGSKNNNIALKKGTAIITLQDTYGNPHDIYLKDTLYIPRFNQNILSVRAAVAKGSNVEFSEHGATLITKDGVKFDIKNHGKLYYLNKCSAEKTRRAAAKHDLTTWHKIFGHCNIPDILKMEACVDGMTITEKKNCSLQCEVCKLGKMPNTRSRKPDKKATSPLELVHCDLAGPISPKSINDFKYVLSFTDDYSGFIMTYFLKNKSDTIHATKQFIADSAPVGNLKRLRSDNGSEFVSKEFRKLLIDNKIRHELSSPYSPHQNGTAERGWRTLFDMSRCMLIESKLNHDLWPYAFLTATYIRNRCFNNRLGITNYEAFYSNKPNVKDMNIFGTVCYAYIQNKKKLDPRAEKGIFIGYDKYSPSYFVFFNETKSVKKVRLITFTNDFEILSSRKNGERESTHEILDSRNFNQVDMPLILSPGQINDQCQSSPHSSGEDRIPQNHLIEENSMSETVEMNQVDSPTENITSAHPFRERRPPAYLSDYTTGEEFSDSEYLNSCATTNVPKTYEEAISCPAAEKWKAAMKKELDSLQENNAYILTNSPENKNVVGGKWVFSIKEGDELEFKARYVAKGYSQIKDVDYHETYAPTTKMTTIRTLMQICAQYNLVIHQMDVKSAYLNAEIDCDIFVQQPQGYKIPGKEKLVRQLTTKRRTFKNWV